MTMTMKVLRIMADGRARTSEELIAESGLNRRHVSNVLRNLARYEMVAAAPVRYEITGSGVERSKFQAKTREEYNRESVKRIRAKREAEKARKAAQAHRQAEGVVKRAKASRDPLSMAWGSFAMEAA